MGGMRRLMRKRNAPKRRFDKCLNFQAYRQAGDQHRPALLNPPTFTARARPAQTSATGPSAADPDQRERLVEAMRAKKQNASSSNGGLGDPHEFAVFGWNRENGICQHPPLTTGAIHQRIVSALTNQLQEIKMSRSGYSDDGEDGWALICYRGAVNSAIKGRRGQKLFIELAAALDAMPEKELISEALVVSGEFCTLGVLGCARGVDIKNLDPDDADAVAAAFDIAPALAREIVFENDEGSWREEAPQKRWKRMREWVGKQILDPIPST